MAAGAPRVHAMLCIGGTSLRESFAGFDRHGCHIVVATPGRLLHLLSEGKVAMLGVKGEAVFVLTFFS